MNADSRGWRIALLPDAFVNLVHDSRSTLPDVMGLLDANGYGVLQLPPPGEHQLLLAVIADQVAEYSHHGYALLAIGLSGVPGDGLHWRRLASLLRHRGVQLPRRHIVRQNVEPGLEQQRLSALLAGYDLLPEEQRLWRDPEINS